MSAKDEIRRQLGNMPTGSYDMADMAFSVRKVEPEKPKQLTFRFEMGSILVDDGNGWRMATAEEIEQLTGGLMCWPSNEEGEL
jgi:hypothetical protein